MAKQMTDSTSAPTHEQIAARAYEIFVERGRPQGRDLDHWLEAEAQLRASIHANGGTAAIRANQSNGRSQTTARVSARARK
jgi:hypothetical protein